MSLIENLEPATRIESILDGEDIEPATRLEYFLKKAASGGGGGGGDSLLVANIVWGDDDTQRLDKTWRECRDADAVIIKEDALTPINIAHFYYVANVTTVRNLQDPTQTDYNVVCMSPDLSGTEGILWVRYTLTTNSETGYPELIPQT